MTDRLKDKIAIVTGGARGQGRSTAELFADEGAIVYACDVDPGESRHRGVHHRTVDIADEADWSALVAEVCDAHSRVDILVNNAAVVLSSDNIVEVAISDLEAVVRVNLLGAILGTRAVIPSMVAARSGSIVNIASTLAQHAAPTQGAYQVSKGALRSLTRHVAVTYARSGVRANSILPGRVDTRMLAGRSDEARRAAMDSIPLGRFAQPREIAYGSLFLASDESSYVTGAELVMDGGVLA